MTFDKDFCMAVNELRVLQTTRVIDEIVMRFLARRTAIPRLTRLKSV